jgi:hypothetical protein
VKNIKMELHLKEIILMDVNMGKEFLDGKMVLVMKVTSRKVL